MSVNHPLSELTKHFTPEDWERVEALKKKDLAELPKHELRRARARAQKETGRSLKLDQHAVAKLEKHADAYLSSLRSHVAAAGGVLTIVAEFPDGEVFIDSLSNIPDYQGNDV